jgi:hypothetical protein
VKRTLLERIAIGIFAVHLVAAVVVHVRFFLG